MINLYFVWQMKYMCKAHVKNCVPNFCGILKFSQAHIEHVVSLKSLKKFQRINTHRPKLLNTKLLTI